MQRSRIVQTLNGDPAASPLGGAHKLGAPYSSHRAPLRVRLGSSLAAALLDGLFEHPAGYASSVVHTTGPSGLLRATTVFLHPARDTGAIVMPLTACGGTRLRQRPPTGSCGSHLPIGKTCRLFSTHTKLDDRITERPDNLSLDILEACSARCEC